MSNYPNIDKKFKVLVDGLSKLNIDEFNIDDDIVLLVTTDITFCKIIPNTISMDTISRWIRSFDMYDSKNRAFVLIVFNLLYYQYLSSKRKVSS